LTQKTVNDVLTLINYKLALGKIQTDPNLSEPGKEALKRGAEDKLSQLQARAEKQ